MDINNRIFINYFHMFLGLISVIYGIKKIKEEYNKEQLPPLEFTPISRQFILKIIIIPIILIILTIYISTKTRLNINYYYNLDIINSINDDIYTLLIIILHIIILIILIMIYYNKIPEAIKNNYILYYYLGLMLIVYHGYKAYKKK